MSYRDDLGAAQDRIQELEQKVRDLEGRKDADVSRGRPSSYLAARAAKARIARQAGAIAAPLLLLLVGGLTFGGGRACIALNAGVTDVALDRLRACAKARELLGEDIEWSMKGCSSYHSSTGGDPMNGGCSSSASYRSPVAGTKARGLYYFSTSSPPGVGEAFKGGSLTVGTEHVSVPATGPCTP